MTDPRAVAKELLDALPVIFTCSQYGSVQLCKEAEEECIDTIMHALADAERRVWMEAAKDCRDQSRVYAGGELMKRHILINMAEFFESKAQAMKEGRT